MVLMLLLLLLLLILLMLLQMDTMSMPASRGASAFAGSRPTSPPVVVNLQQQQSSYSHPVRQQQLQQHLLQHQGRSTMT